MTAGAQQGAQQSSSVATLDDRNEHQAGLAPQQSAASPKEQASEEGSTQGDYAVSTMIDERVKEIQHKSNSQSSLKAREAAKRQKKRLKELNKLLSDKCKSSDETKQALYQAAVAATNEKFTEASEAEAAESGRQAAVRALAERDEQVRRGTLLQDKLQALCRELQLQVKQMSKEHEIRMTAEAQKRKEAVESMGDMMNGITERLNEQQTNMEQTCKDNDELRSQLGRMAEVAKLSEQLREKQTEENERIKAQSLAREELFRQQEEKMLTQMKASHAHQKVAAEQVSELKDALTSAAHTVRDCHKTNIALATEKKELLTINISLQDEFTSTRARAVALEDQCNEKDSQVRKLQTVKQRLESLCRFQQEKLKEQAAQKPACSDESKETIVQYHDGGGSSAPAVDSSSTCANAASEPACATGASEEAAGVTCAQAPVDGSA